MMKLYSDTNVLEINLAILSTAKEMLSCDLMNPLLRIYLEEIIRNENKYRCVQMFYNSKESQQP